MLVYTISDAIAVILLIFLIVVAIIGLLISRVSNWFDHWWKKPSKDEPIIDKTTKDYSELFKDSNGNPRDVETRIFIKALAEKGYSTEEITEILRKMENMQ